MKVYRIKSLGKFYKNQDSWSDNEDDGQLYTNLLKVTRMIRADQRRWESRPVDTSKPWQEKSREFWNNAEIASYDLVPTQ